MKFLIWYHVSAQSLLRALKSSQVHFGSKPKWRCSLKTHFPAAFRLQRYSLSRFISSNALSLFEWLWDKARRISKVGLNQILPQWILDWNTAEEVANCSWLHLMTHFFRGYLRQKVCMVTDWKHWRNETIIYVEVNIQGVSLVQHHRFIGSRTGFTLFNSAAAPLWFRFPMRWIIWIRSSLLTDIMACRNAKMWISPMMSDLWDIL